MDEAILKRVEKYANHFQQISGMDSCALNMRERKFHKRPPIFCRDSCPIRDTECDCFNFHHRNCVEADRWDGRYTFYCPMDLIFVAAYADSRMGIPLGMVVGPFLLEEFEADAFAQYDEHTLEELKKVPVLSTSKGYHFGETVGALLTCCATRDQGFSPTEHRWELINKMFYFATAGTGGTAKSYSIEMEHRLIQFISDGDCEGARYLINQLIGYINYASGGNIEAGKARCTELLVLMSRAAIEAGAAIDTIFLLNEKYFEEFTKCTSPEDLGVWLSSAATGYASYVRDASDSQYSHVVSKAINHIRQNFASKITLEETSKMVYLTRSYFSKLFADETGTTFSNYVIEVRIEKSKPLLLDSSLKLADVAHLVGFADQSYFTKCFRKKVGVSPGKYRSCQGKLESA